MNPELVDILDRALRYSIWVFLLSYVLILLAARTRVRKKKQRVGDLYEKMGEAEEATPVQSFHLSDWPIAFNSMLLALICGGLFFVVYTLVPFPTVQNLVTTSNWQVVPLRVTQVKYDRYYEGFSVSGEVWNQTQEPMSDIRLQVEVIGTDDKPIDEFEAKLDKNPLPPGESSHFEFKYEKNSPFIKGYRLTFLAPGGATIPHLTGFDTR